MNINQTPAPNQGNDESCQNNIYKDDLTGLSVHHLASQVGVLEPGARFPPISQLRTTLSFSSTDVGSCHPLRLHAISFWVYQYPISPYSGPGCVMARHCVPYVGIRFP